MSRGMMPDSASETVEPKRDGLPEKPGRVVGDRPERGDRPDKATSPWLPNDDHEPDNVRKAVKEAAGEADDDDDEGSDDEPAAPKSDRREKRVAKPPDFDPSAAAAYLRNAAQKGVDNWANNQITQIDEEMAWLNQFPDPTSLSNEQLASLEPQQSEQLRWAASRREQLGQIRNAQVPYGASFSSQQASQWATETSRAINNFATSYGTQYPQEVGEIMRMAMQGKLGVSPQQLTDERTYASLLSMAVGQRQLDRKQNRQAMSGMVDAASVAGRAGAGGAATVNSSQAAELYGKMGLSADQARRTMARIRRKGTK